MKLLVKLFFLAAVTYCILFVSCKDDNENSPVPPLNKFHFSLENITDADTLYSTDPSPLILQRVLICDGSSNENIGHASLIEKETTISDGKNIIGKVVYEEDCILSIDIFDFCTITKLFDLNGKPKNAYVIKPSSGERANYDVFLGIFQKISGISVEIYNNNSKLPS